MKKICVIPGDGIGKEVVPAALKVLTTVYTDLKIDYADAGWGYFQEHGVSVPKETLEKITDCGAALFGAVSSPSKKVEGYKSTIITMRQELDLFANIRPVKSMPTLSPRGDIDLIVVRENTEGMYSGRERMEGHDTAIAERVISRQASKKIAEKAIDIIRNENRKKLTIIHKANILPLTDGLFRDTVREVANNCDLFEELVVDELLVDIATLKMLSEPTQYDVLVTTNLFGDILSDAAAHWCGGMGMAPSINLGEEVAVAEPVHGSAPDIAGKMIANPIATILSGVLLIRYYWKDFEVADRVEAAINDFLSTDYSHIPIESGYTERITEGIIKKLS